jgi:starch synthase
MNPIRVLSVASEVYPLIKTGGLADVVGALPIALQGEAVETRTLVPGYPEVMSRLGAPARVLEWPAFFGGPTCLLSVSCGELDMLVLDAPHLFARPGNPYVSSDGTDWPDNGLRFAALSRMAAIVGLGVVPAFVPDVVHTHDWQAGLTHAYLHYGQGRRPGRVMTVHNLAYQGRFPHEMLDAFGLPEEAFTLHGIEYYGAIGFLKAGLQFADRITTVSPTYAVEIQSDEGGMGLGGLLRERGRDVRGILNGIDISVWDPATDVNLPQNYDANHLQDRTANKLALQQRFGLERSPDALLLGVISRMSWQKGLDFLLDTIPTILNSGMQLALLGAGDPDLQDRYLAIAAAHSGRIGVVVGYDEALAHLIQGGADALVVPSRYEPCGLTQLCALRYGAVPIVSRVGGLEDTVIDEDQLAGGRTTGFKFGPVTVENLSHALRRAHAKFEDKSAWRHIQESGMSTDVSWRDRARRYADLYRELVDRRQS